MIDWLGARKPLEVMLLMTVVLSLGAAAVEYVVVPVVEGLGPCAVVTPARGRGRRWRS